MVYQKVQIALECKSEKTVLPDLENNAVWTYPFDTNDSTNSDATNSFMPSTQWYLSAQPVTRSQNPCTITEDGKETKTFCLQLIFDLEVNYYSISCLGTVAPASKSESWKINIPIPPTPSPTPPCTSNLDCKVGQVCATDLTPPKCVPQPCDQMMTCPAGFVCKNEVCEQES